MDHPVGVQIGGAHIGGLVPGRAQIAAGLRHGFSQGVGNGVLVGIGVGNGVAVGLGRKLAHVVDFLGAVALGIQHLHLILLTDGIQIFGKELHALVDRGDVRVLQTADRDGQVQGGVQLFLWDLGGIDHKIGIVYVVLGGSGLALSRGGFTAASGAFSRICAAAAAGQQSDQHGCGEDRCNEFLLLHSGVPPSCIGLPCLQNGRCPRPTLCLWYPVCAGLRCIDTM